jgi:malate dehydrogenase (oxaloacetate-decarboxylating)
LNKGTAFTYDERTRFDLHGLLPLQVETLDDQVTRAYQAYVRKQDHLERHIYLRQLQDTNEVLFYRLVLDHIDEMMPIVYTLRLPRGASCLARFIGGRAASSSLIHCGIEFRSSCVAVPTRM